MSADRIEDLVHLIRMVHGDFDRVRRLERVEALRLSEDFRHERLTETTPSNTHDHQRRTDRHQAAQARPKLNGACKQKIGRPISSSRSLRCWLTSQIFHFG